MSTYFIALDTEEGRDPLGSKGSPTQETEGVSVSTRCLLDIVKANGETPENTRKSECERKLGTEFRTSSASQK